MPGSDPDKDPSNSVAHRWWRNWTVWLILLSGLLIAFEVAHITLTQEWRALPLSMVPALLTVPLLLFLDRHEPEPRWARVQGLLYGLTIAIFVAGVVNGIFELLVSSVVGPELGWALSAVICAPVVEEAVKGLGVQRFRSMGLVDGPLDGVIFAGWIGLGFAMLENVTYLGSAESSQLLFITFVVRCVAAPLCHPLFTAFTGYGIGESVRANKRWAPFAGYAIAVFLHAFWNLSTFLGLAGVVVSYLGVGAVLFAFAFYLVKLRNKDNARARRAVQYLVFTSSVTPEEATAATDNSARAAMLLAAPPAQRGLRLQRLVTIHRAAVAVDDAHAARMAPFAVRRANSLLAEVRRTAPSLSGSLLVQPYRFAPPPRLQAWPTTHPAVPPASAPTMPAWQPPAPPRPVDPYGPPPHSPR